MHERQKDHSLESSLPVTRAYNIYEVTLTSIIDNQTFFQSFQVMNYLVGIVPLTVMKQSQRS